MLSQNSQTIIESIVSRKVASSLLFTAHDITVEARTQTQERISHQDAKDYIHELMQPLMLANSYRRELIDVGLAVAPWLYLPFFASATSYANNRAAASQPSPAPMAPLVHRMRTARIRGQSPDGRGRICVPSDYVRQIGLKEGQLAFVFVKSGELEISPTNTGHSADAEYYVDKDDNIRVSGHLVQRANLTNVSYQFRVSNNCIFVS